MNEYQRLLKEARENRDKLTRSQFKQIRDLYKEAAKDLKIKANKARKGSLTERWLKDYSKAVRAKVKEMNKMLKSIIEENMKSSAEYATAIQLDFFDQINMRYGLGMSKSFTSMFSQVPSDVVDELVKGNIYKDGRGLSKRIWWTGNKVNNDIDKVIQKGIVEKKSAIELAQDLQTYVNPDAQKDWNWKRVYPGTSKTIDYNAQRLARTSISHAYTLSLLKSCERNPFITKVRWHSVFAPGRTCSLCKDRDGREYLLKDCPMDHPNGMCYQEPLVDDSLENIGSRLRNWVDGSSDSTLDNWYREHGDYFSGENNIFSNSSKKNVNYGPNNDIISDKKWLESNFPSEKKFNKHVEKHLDEYGDITPEEYLNKSRELLAEPLNEDVEGFISKDGFIFKYRKSTNDFTIGRADGKISTLFKPTDGYKYWLQQIKDYKKEE
ncbi:hypothetical protein [Clostridium ljungdahlii]|uniref:Phage Mu protein F like protein n=1 Tax=Clostridium ljungdahlii TaxID=1538 RepID=A0A170NKM4_9CLOT|nr:hypothetical protein [Clostridium ljungdahlii]OAA91248.1 hypothetical protein WY13_00813 [Clostridium ljungdahlii]